MRVDVVGHQQDLALEHAGQVQLAISARFICCQATITSG
jgi:hypothetical protein